MEARAKNMREVRGRAAQTRKCRRLAAEEARMELINLIFPTEIAVFPTKYRFAHMYRFAQREHFFPRNLYCFPHNAMFASFGACSDWELWISDVH
jgi:hypothetical protein